MYRQNKAINWVAEGLRLVQDEFPNSSFSRD